MLYTVYCQPGILIEKQSPIDMDSHLVSLHSKEEVYYRQD